MTTRTYGYLYDRGRSVTDDAANIHRTIKTLTKAGLLPGDWKYSVRKRSSTHSWAIEVQATSPRPLYAVDPDARVPGGIHPETGEYAAAWVDRLTREAGAVYRTLKELHDAHNHDGSDALSGYSDVKFYGHVAIDTAPGVPRYQQGMA